MTPHERARECGHAYLDSGGDALREDCIAKAIREAVAERTREIVEMIAAAGAKDLVLSFGTQGTLLGLAREIRARWPEKRA